MSTRKKKVIATAGDSPSGKTAAARSKRKARRTEAGEPAEFPFGKINFRFMLIGLGIIALGMILMLGGRQSDPNVWAPEVIYSWRRVVLAPVVILAGLLVEVYAIFAKETERSEG